MYKVYVDESSPLQEEANVYLLGEYLSYQGARNAAEHLIDKFLRRSYRYAMKAEVLLGVYKLYGDKPQIAAEQNHDAFSAMNYAQQRCYEICGENQAQKYA